MASKKPVDKTSGDVQIAIAQDYDDYPYDSHPFPVSHPDRLAVLATLFGMQPADPQKCRVLELGCATGGNLIPMAMQLPKSQFFGVDLSSKQVEQGNQLVKELKLKNIKIEHKDILGIGGKARKFDYIICHGVYSWVPPDVRDKILTICRDYLSENGIAYISYNTYPGWHMRESIRNMMKYHTAQFEQPQDKINQSRALLRFLVKSVNTENNPYGQHLQNELNLLSKVGDAYIAHEHLERHNHPVYFHEFVQSASDHDLQYLAEAEFNTMLASNFSPEVASTLQKISTNIVQQEQYMDFLRNRTFRSTLLCHKSVELNRNVNAECLKELYVAASPMQVVQSDSEEGKKGVHEFISPLGVRIAASGELTKAALSILAENWPTNMAFKDLYASAAEKAGLDNGDQSGRLAADLLKLYTAKAIELHVIPSSFQLSVSDKPMVSSLVRQQAKSGLNITNQRHESAQVNEPTRQILLLLDGKHTQKQLMDKLLVLVKDGTLVLREGGKPIDGMEKSGQYVEQFLQLVLRELGRRALLIS